MVGRTILGIGKLLYTAPVDRGDNHCPRRGTSRPTARLGNCEHLAHVLALLEGDDGTADIVNRVLLCVMDLGDREAIDRALATAQGFLEADPPAEPLPWDDTSDGEADGT